MRTKAIYRSLNNVDQSLLTPAQKDKIEQDIEETGRKSREAVQKRLDGEMLIARDLFNKQMAQKMKDQEAPNSEIELTQRALKGDKMAQQTLDVMQKRKEDAAKASQVEKDKGLDVPGLAQAVADGQDAPVAIKGSMGSFLSRRREVSCRSPISYLPDIR